MTQMPQRLESLDTLRGLTIAGMILVNNPGDWSHTWPLLKHAPWDGLTLADLVFPFFLVAMGISTSLSINGQLQKGKTKADILKKAIIRTSKLFGLGLALNLLWDSHWETFRIPDVLQRIAITYLFCVCLYLFTNPIAWIGNLIFSSGLALLLLKVFPPPSGNWYGMVDHWLFGQHVYGPTAPMDAEGFLSGLTAFQSGIWGMLWGYWILNGNRTLLMKIPIGLLAIGILLHLFVQPMNKLLWTPAFAWVTAGLALLLLQFCLRMEYDPIFTKLAEPFRRVGQNAVVIYVVSEVLEHFWVGHWFKQITPRNWFIEAIGQISPWLYLNSLLWALLLVAFFVGIGWVLYQRRIFIKV